MSISFKSQMFRIMAAGFAPASFGFIIHTAGIAHNPPDGRTGTQLVTACDGDGPGLGGGYGKLEPDGDGPGLGGGY